MKAYDHTRIEKKWQKEWENKGLYKTSDTAKGKDNFYLLTEFPYPSGNLHVGHWYAFAVPDILARKLRMEGKNVLYPIGFDAFGLPAENAAIKHKLDPAKWTRGNIEYMKKQIRSMGASFDWSREVITCDPSYYRWTQWLFLQFFKKGLAYRKETAVNWCPKDKTVLANEQVVDGRCERCDSEVVQKMMLQWNLKITDYADRLIEDLTGLDWPQQIKDSQRNWIGRSEGAEIDFPLRLSPEKKYTYVLLHGFTGTPDAPRFLYWKTELERDGHTVIIPALPNTENPSEDEQVEAALTAHAYDGNTILFGHSLGCAVALKVLEKLQRPIARLVLAGGFVDPKFIDHARNFEKRFRWKFDAAAIKRNVNMIQLIHDPRDYAVSERQLLALESLLGVKALRIDSQEPHFTGEKELPVLRFLRPTITVFTTRADTLFGATYLSLAPEHPFIQSAIRRSPNEGFTKPLISNLEEVKAYVERSAKKTELERQTDQKEKTGVKLAGVMAVNPATGKEIPLFVADYVLGHYGTGAVMGVPAHDERDFAFATKFKVPIAEVVQPVLLRTSGADALREKESSTDRTSVLAVVKHWSEEKYLAVRYLPTDTRGVVSGGVDQGEDPAETGKREIREETGYSKARFVRQLGGTIHCKYWSDVRKTNVFCHFTPLLFQLEDGSMQPIEPHESERHEVRWMSRVEMDAFINREDMRIAWNRAWGGVAYTGEGVLTNSGPYNSLATVDAQKAITAALGLRKTTYKLRDWIVSRQRYWGVPIPIVHCPRCGSVPVSDKDLPVLLPKVKDYLPEGSGKSPLAKAKSFVKVKCPQCKGAAERETDTLDTFVDSSWYFLRYADPKNKKEFAARKKQDNWMPVNLYSGGAEHTTMHLLYSRFWHKALFDLGLVKDPEPYAKRMNRSLILGPDGQKMSKSRGNVIDPDEVVARLGADTVRMYLAFVGPYNEVSSFPWNPDGVVGVRRFIERVWRMASRVSLGTNLNISEVLLNKTIKKVGEDIQALKFNTAISQLMIFLNEIEKTGIDNKQWKIFLKLLAPFASHVAEELWSNSGERKSIHLSTWPKYDESKLRDETILMAIQVNGKTRGEMKVAQSSDKLTQENTAREAVGERLEGKEIIRTIVVPGRLVNFVIKE